MEYTITEKPHYKEKQNYDNIHIHESGFQFFFFDALAKNIEKILF